ncbi:hypothetical protein ACVWYG_003487 [Pedobacter sp. UYEF25]
MSQNMRFDTKGIPLEMSFVIRNTSLITAKDLEQIEQMITESNFKISFLKGTQSYIREANFFTVDYPIPYSEMLKVLSAK